MTDGAVKILGICGSHRKEQNTYYALKKCLEGLGSLNIPVETEIVDLSRMKIEDCKGCHVCFLRAGGDSYCPVIHDDMDSIYPKLIEADGIVVASPVHWWSGTTKIRRFIDRTNTFCGAGNTEYAGALYNKVGGVITVAYDVHGGTEVAATHLITWMLAENMIVVGTQGAHIAGTATCNLGVPTAAPDSVKTDHHGMKTVYEVGKRVAETAYLMKTGRANIPVLADRAPGNAADREIDWDKFYRFENSFPKEHYGIEGKLATSEKAFWKFIEEMKHRKKSEGNTWGTLPDEDVFVSVWLEKRGLILLSDAELYELCPEYYNFYLKED
ncbi:hypothetical protein AGMMS49983_08040 [Clostridia bacterium]|nr:hypothetical protein AGMMS49983_08040 [Clostridia bacterium]